MNRKPFPNEEKEESTVMTTAIGMTAMFVILLLAFYAIVAYYPENGEEDRICPKWGNDSDYIWKPAIMHPPDRAHIDFPKMNPEPKPTSLYIKLMKNGEDIGIYVFQSDDDGELTLKSGTDLANLTYFDMLDNKKINIGDSVVIADLSLGSEYVVAVVRVDTDECIGTIIFSTPPG